MNEDDDILRQQALVLFERAYRHHMNGELADAMILYKRSIALYPTAEAYTFLGWVYSMLNRYQEAIEMCHKAIETDPSFGNPYNDIGSYLIELGQWQEAIPWLEKAIAAPRYEPRQFPFINLGRVYEHLGEYAKALRYYQQALEVAPLYLPAEYAKNILLGKLN